jgi:hypothetical protein
MALRLPGARYAQESPPSIDAPQIAGRRSNAMHYPGHLREAFYGWLDEGCPPVATVEVNYEPQTWLAERLLKRMLACSDVMPGYLYRDVVDRYGIERSRRQTCGSVARVLLDDLHVMST